MKSPASRELVADLLYGSNDNKAKYGYNFGMVTGGLAAHGIYDRTSHLKSDEVPAGQNVGFLDGHVSWRKWNPPTYPPLVNGTPLPRWDPDGSGGIPASFW